MDPRDGAGPGVDTGARRPEVSLHKSCSSGHETVQWEGPEDCWVCGKPGVQAAPIKIEGQMPYDVMAYYRRLAAEGRQA